MFSNRYYDPPSGVTKLASVTMDLESDTVHISHNIGSCHHSFTHRHTYEEIVDASCAGLSFLQMYYCFAVSSLVLIPKQSLVPLGELEAEISAFYPKLHQIVKNGITWPVFIKHISRHFGIPETQTRQDLMAENSQELCSMQIPGLEEPRRAVQCPGCKRFFFCERAAENIDSAARQALTTHWRYSCSEHSDPYMEFRIQMGTRMFSYAAGDNVGGRLMYADDFRRWDCPPWNLNMERSWTNPAYAFVTRAVDVPAPYRRPRWFSRNSFRFLERWKIMSFHTGQEMARHNCLALVAPPRNRKGHENSRKLGERANVLLSRINEVCMRLLKAACAYFEDPSRTHLRALLLTK